MGSYVNDFNDTVKQYYKELKPFKPKTKEEEKALFAKGKDNPLVKEEIIKSNLKFVFDTAKRYKGYGVPLDELISEGNMGLLKAYEKFDVTKDVKFFSYATWWIRVYIQSYIKERNKIDSIETKEDDSLNANIQNNNVVHDCEDENLSVKDVIMSNLEDIETEECNKHNKYVVDSLLSKVDERARKIIEMYYGINCDKNMTLEEIGNEFGLTKERVRQISKKNIRYIRSKALEEKYSIICV